MRPHFCLFLLICLLSHSAWSETKYNLVKELQVKADIMRSDNLGNIYVVSNDKIDKYNKQGELLLTYSNKLLGRIDAIDVSNPLKVLLFYRDLTQVVFLDNRLSQIGDPLPLEELGMDQATLTCTSHSNGFWVYDRFQFQLTRINKQLDAERQTGNVSQLLGIELEPNFLFEVNNWVYLNDPSVGILVFDIYGTYSKTIPIKGLTDFLIYNQRIYFKKDGRLMAYQLKTFDQGEIAIPEKDFAQFSLNEERLYLYKSGRLRIYSVKQ